MAEWKQAARSMVPEQLKPALRRLRGLSPARPTTAVAPPLTAATALTQAYRDLWPLEVSVAPPRVRRLIMLTDSVAAGSLFGGVGTALLFATQLAKAMGAELELVTRHHHPEESRADIAALLALHEVPQPEVLYLSRSGWHPFEPRIPTQPVALGPTDVVLTTSWWTSWSALQSVPAARIVHLLQEDERMFYAAGDEHLRCSEILDNADVHFVMNTSLLLDHLVADAVRGPARSGIFFEPAFPRALYHPGRKTGRTFTFYARPKHVRNLFPRAVEVLETAARRGLFDEGGWTVNLVGASIPEIAIPARVAVRTFDTVPWPTYAQVIRDTDLALSLMYTPHPSYPPLDLAASGAVVVTNSFGKKQSLEGYSANILCRPTDVESLVQGLFDGLNLLRDDERRTKNFANSQLLRDWSSALAPAVEQLAATLAA